MNEERGKYTLYWGLVGAWVATDVVTKAWAESWLGCVHPFAGCRTPPREIFGEFFRFTLVYNQGAAFGMQIGDWSRWVFTILTVGALFMLAHLFRETRPADKARTIALALVTAGAIGNLVDRIRSPKGVIDFIDVGFGNARFWTFNVADVGVSCGAVLLALVLWREERSRHSVPSPEPPQATPPAQPSTN